MIRHHYTLEHIVKECQREIIGMYISDCFTQEKNTLMIECTDEKHEVWLECSLETNDGTVFIKNDFARARHNSRDCFPAIIGQQIRDIYIIPHDRIIALQTTSYILYIFLFSGGKSNIVFCDKENLPLQHFFLQNLLTQYDIQELLDNDRRHFHLHDKATANEVELYLSTFKWTFNVEGEITKNLSDALPELGKYYSRHIENLFTKTQPFATNPLTILAQLIITTYNSAKNTNEYYCLEQNNTYVFSLIPLDDYVLRYSNSSISSVIRRTISLEKKRKRIQEITRKLQNTLEKKLKKTERTLWILENENSSLQKIEDYKLWADILFSQPNGRVKPQQSEFHTTDWMGEYIMIPVSPDKTLIENGEIYYTKIRNIQQSAKIRHLRIPPYKKELEQLNSWLTLLSDNTSLDVLEELFQKVFKTSTKKMNSFQEHVPKFRVFVLGSDFTLYVGKNATNNDELTMRFAKPNDLWFHARGVSGSHAVLRQTGKEKPTKKVIETAASIAAYYSSARNASYTPVAYTEKKYIRKPKGANAGAVIMEREKVIMVTPCLPEGQSDKE